MIQYGKFSNGGYYLHKVTDYWTGRCSAWFDAGGQLLDAEHITRGGVSRGVRRGSPMWLRLGVIGRRFVNFSVGGGL